MFTQLKPLELQRSHWRAKAGAGKPVQVPSVSVSIWPTLVLPLIVGEAVFAGGAVTAAVCVESADVAPTVERFSVRCVASVNVTEFTVTLPSIDAPIRHDPDPGSQNAEPEELVPVRVTLVEA